MTSNATSIRVAVLVILCFQTSVFTLSVRYSRGILKETYSNYEVLLVGEVIKILFSAYMIDGLEKKTGLLRHLLFVISKSHKMVVLAMIYGLMNILYFVSLRNIGAGLFAILSQCKILTTALFSVILLSRSYSTTRWATLVALLVGVVLFSEPIISSQKQPHHVIGPDRQLKQTPEPVSQQTTAALMGNPVLGMAAVLTQMFLSGYSCIYFEKVIKSDPLQLNIWERNFQLAMASIPVYMAFIASQHYQRQVTLSPDEQEPYHFGRGWSSVTLFVTLLEASGGLLVALSIKYGDAVLKTLATTGSIVITALVDHVVLQGPLTSSMIVAGAQVILAIVMYTFDAPQQKDDAEQQKIPLLARWLPKATGRRIFLLTVLPILALPLRSVDSAMQRRQSQQLQGSVAAPVVEFTDHTHDNDATASGGTGGGDITIDVVSVGSKHRMEYQVVQKETWASPEYVRHYFGITEDDDLDKTCWGKYESIQRIREHVSMCRDLHQNGGPFLRMHQYMPATWVARKPNPTGWFCAQARPGVGLAKARRMYETAGSDSLPDFLVLVDDDSYIDLPQLRSQMFSDLNSSLRRVWATCLTIAGSRDRKNLYRVGHFGGGGIIISKGTLKQRMMAPIFCADGADEKGSGWNKHVCNQLERNLLGEKHLFTEGMTIFHLIEAFYSQDPNCFLSDWPLGFFVDYYSLADPWDDFPLESSHNVRMRPLVANSVKHFFHNLDPFQKDEQARLANTTGSLCPVTTWEKVKRNTKCPPGVLACHYLSAKEMKELFLSSKHRAFDSTAASFVL